MGNIERITQFEAEVISSLRSLSPHNTLIVKKMDGDTAGMIEIRRKKFIQDSDEGHDISKTD